MEVNVSNTTTTRYQRMKRVCTGCFFAAGCLLSLGIVYVALMGTSDGFFTKQSEPPYLVFGFLISGVVFTEASLLLTLTLLHEKQQS